MRAARLALVAGVAGLMLASSPAFAQAKKPAANTIPTPSKAQLDRAASNLRVLIAAFQSDKIPEAVKSALFACVYSNPFSRISEGTDKLLAARKASNTDPNMVVGAMAAACGFRPSPTPTPAPAPKK